MAAQQALSAQRCICCQGVAQQEAVLNRFQKKKKGVREAHERAEHIRSLLQRHVAPVL